MVRNRQSCRISLYTYLESDSAVGDAFDAGAVTKDGDEFYIDINKFDRFALKKLHHLKGRAENTKSIQDITEYLNYATIVFSSKDEFISSIVSIWNWEEDWKSSLRQEYNCAKANYRELFEHYALAVDLWLAAEDGPDLQTDKNSN